MRKFWKAVENATNIAVIVAACLLAVLFYRAYESDRPEGPKIGATLPSLAGYSWQSSPQTLVMVLRAGCHFCEESMPFYRRLYNLEERDALKAKIVAIFPDSAEATYMVLSAQKLPIPSISQFNLSRLSVSGTPTLILADQQGKVEKDWVGKLDSEGEKSVLAAIERPAAATKR